MNFTAALRNPDILEVIYPSEPLLFNTKNSVGMTHLTLAVKSKNIACLNFLIKNENVNINSQNNNGDTALTLAMSLFDSPMTKLLLNHPKI